MNSLNLPLISKEEKKESNLQKILDNNLEQSTSSKDLTKNYFIIKKGKKKILFSKSLIKNKKNEVNLNKKYSKSLIVGKKKKIKFQKKVYLVSEYKKFYQKKYCCGLFKIIN